MTNWVVILMLLFPLMGFLVGSIGQNKGFKKLAAWVVTASIFGSFLMVVYLFTQNSTAQIQWFDWISMDEWTISFGFLVDHLSILWSLIITGIGFLIHLYSLGYMHDDDRLARFMAYLSLFIFFMLVLVMGNNLLMTFIGWEGVGLCSYLLIGFWHQNLAYNRAAKKAFIMNRIGDMGVILAGFLLLQYFGTLDYTALQLEFKAFQGPHMAIVAMAGLLLLGATGKSAQLPLYTWLPDAMAGPTPVSALIHAATMVTAGIYLIVRLHFMFETTPEIMQLMTWVGGATALWAASIAVFQTDIKKVLAFSTVSQLGLIFLALGLGAFSSAVFHVLTHAFFKACLFLGAGSVIHALHHQQDIRQMGGLRSKLPITFLTFLVSTLAISGIPPFSGFFSKDEILLAAFQLSPWWWGVGIITSMLTAFYMFRLLFLVFFGHHRGQSSHIYESPISITMPLLVLAVGAALTGLLGLPHWVGASHWISDYLGIEPHSIAVNVSTELILMGLAVLGATLSMGLAYWRYGIKANIPAVDDNQDAFSQWAIQQYRINGLYHGLVVWPIEFLSKQLHRWMEPLIDSISVFIGWLAVSLGRLLNRFQTGNLGHYVFYMVVGMTIMLGFVLFYKL